MKSPSLLPVLFVFVAIALVSCSEGGIPNGNQVVLANSNVSRATYQKIEYEMPLSEIETLLGGKGTRATSAELPRAASLRKFTSVGAWLKREGSQGTLFVVFSGEPGPVSKNYGAIFESHENGTTRYDWKKESSSGTVTRD